MDNYHLTHHHQLNQQTTPPPPPPPHPPQLTPQQQQQQQQNYHHPHHPLMSHHPLSSTSSSSSLSNNNIIPYQKTTSTPPPPPPQQQQPFLHQFNYPPNNHYHHHYQNFMKPNNLNNNKLNKNHHHQLNNNTRKHFNSKNYNHHPGLETSKAINHPHGITHPLNVNNFINHNHQSYNHPQTHPSPFASSPLIPPSHQIPEFQPRSHLTHNRQLLSSAPSLIITAEDDHFGRQSRPPIRTSNSVIRSRTADHLVTTPGVSFASSLCVHTSSLGTVRVVSQVLTNVKPKKSSSSSLTKSKSTTITTAAATTTTKTTTTLTETDKGVELNEQGSSSTPPLPSSSFPPTSSSNLTPHQDSHSPDLDPTISSTGTAESGDATSRSDLRPPATAPSSAPVSISTDSQIDNAITPKSEKPQSQPQAKAKSWADLLRKSSRPASAQSDLSSKTLGASKNPSTNQSSPNDKSSSRAEQSKKIELLDDLASLTERLNTVAKTHEARHLVPRGLINNGNICFANAILQVLVHCPPFYNLMSYLAQVIPNDLGGETRLLDAMIGFVQEFRALDRPASPTPGSANGSKARQNGVSALQTDDAFIAQSVWTATKGNSRFDAMRRGQQEDAQEFLCFFLETLHEELMLAIEKHERLARSKLRGAQPAPAPVVPKPNLEETPGDGDWLEVGSKGRAAVTRSTVSFSSPLSQIFDFKTRSVLHRLGQKDSVTFEPNNMLQLSIEHPSVNTIEQALAHFSSPDVISDMMAKSGQKVSATKQVYIETFPQVLVLHIKRFNYDSEVETVKKSHKEIRFKTELKIPASMRSPSQRSNNEAESGVNFKLFAAVYHHGVSASGGHYTVSIKQQASNRWIYIDDVNISPITEASVLSPRSNSDLNNINNKTSSNNGSEKEFSSGSVGGNGGKKINGNGNLISGGSNRTPYLLFYTRC